MKLAECRVCGATASIIGTRGGGEEIFIDDESLPLFSVMCDRIHTYPQRTHILGKWYETEEEAIKEWNFEFGKKYIRIKDSTQLPKEVREKCHI